jgi:hypothetical protein
VTTSETVPLPPSLTENKTSSPATPKRAEVSLNWKYEVMDKTSLEPVGFFKVHSIIVPLEAVISLWKQFSGGTLKGKEEKVGKKKIMPSDSGRVPTPFRYSKLLL